MTLEELAARFPEIPASLHAEPALSTFADSFADLLRAARRPSACSTAHDAANHYYLKLVGPLAIHGYGLSSREKVVAQMQGLLEAQAADPDGFAASLVPAQAARDEIHGPGCG
jgi:hypothetical protein